MKNKVKIEEKENLNECLDDYLEEPTETSSDNDKFVLVDYIFMSVLVLFVILFWTVIYFFVPKLYTLIFN